MYRFGPAITPTIAPRTATIITAINAISSKSSVRHSLRSTVLLHKTRWRPTVVTHATLVAPVASPPSRLFSSTTYKGKEKAIDDDPLQAVDDDPSQAIDEDALHFHKALNSLASHTGSSSSSSSSSSVADDALLAYRVTYPPEDPPDPPLPLNDTPSNAATSSHGDTATPVRGRRGRPPKVPKQQASSLERPPSRTSDSETNHTPSDASSSSSVSPPHPESAYSDPSPPSPPPDGKYADIVSRIVRESAPQPEPPPEPMSLDAELDPPPNVIADPGKRLARLASQPPMILSVYHRMLASQASEQEAALRPDNPFNEGLKPNGDGFAMAQKSVEIYRTLREHIQQTANIHVHPSMLVSSVRQFQSSSPERLRKDFQQSALFLVRAALHAGALPSKRSSIEWPIPILDLSLAVELYEVSLPRSSPDEDPADSSKSAQDGAESAKPVVLDAASLQTLTDLHRILLKSQTFEGAQDAARVFVDPRNRSPIRNRMFRETIPHLQGLCELTTNEKLGRAGQDLRIQTVAIWQAAIEKCLEGGKTSKVAWSMVVKVGSKNSGSQSSDSRNTPSQSSANADAELDQEPPTASGEYKWSEDAVAMGKFMVLLAKHGKGLAPAAFFQRLRENVSRLMMRYARMESKSTANAVPSKSFLANLPCLPRPYVAGAIDLMANQTLAHQAALILAHQPLRDRTPEMYESLLRIHGEGGLRYEHIGRDYECEARDEQDPLSAMLSAMSDYDVPNFAPSRFYQTVLFTQVMGHPEVRASPDLQKRMFEARMVSHGRHGSVHVVTQDLFEMHRLGLIPHECSQWDAEKIARAISCLSTRAQLGVLHAYIRKGEWEFAGEIGGGLYDILGEPSLISSDDRQQVGREDSRNNRTNRNFILNALIDPSVNPVMEQDIDAFLAQLNHFVAVVGLTPDALTRNFILLLVARKRIPVIHTGPKTFDDQGRTMATRSLAPQQKDLTAVLDLFVSCGVLRRFDDDGGDGDAAMFNAESASPSPSPSQMHQLLRERRTSVMNKYVLPNVQDAQFFLTRDATILKSLAHVLASRGWHYETDMVIHWLKEGEKMAQRLKERERPKFRARDGDLEQRRYRQQTGKRRQDKWTAAAAADPSRRSRDTGIPRWAQEDGVAQGSKWRNGSGHMERTEADEDDAEWDKVDWKSGPRWVW